MDIIKHFVDLLYPTEEGKETSKVAYIFVFTGIVILIILGAIILF